MSAGSKNIRPKEITEAGGKNASLGELYSALAAEGVRVTVGFALTAETYRDALAAAGVEAELRRMFTGFDHHDVALLAERAAAARQHGLSTTLSQRRMTCCSDTANRC